MLKELYCCVPRNIRDRSFFNISSFFLQLRDSTLINLLTTNNAHTRQFNTHITMDSSKPKQTWPTSPPPPPPTPKRVCFLLVHKYGIEHSPRRFIVNIWPADRRRQTLQGIDFFFSVELVSCETDESVQFWPTYVSLEDGQRVWVRYADPEDEDEDDDLGSDEEDWMNGIEGEGRGGGGKGWGKAEDERLEMERIVKEEKKRLEMKNLARRKEKARRRRANGGLTRVGRRRAWKSAGGEERKPINGKLLERWYYGHGGHVLDTLIPLSELILFGL